MKLDHAVLRRTRSGEAALRGAEFSIPVDYRRILAVLDGDTHVDAIRGYLRRYADELIEDWLFELIELGYVEIADSDGGQKPNLEELVNSDLGTRILDDLRDERLHDDGEASIAGVVLGRKHAYLSTGRLQNRTPLSKAAAECVALIVEDDPDQAALADLRVSMGGYGVRIARSRQELVEELNAQPPPELLLLDVKLPDGNGFDILAGLRRHPKFSMMPVILLTVLDSAEDIERGLSLGADGYVTKPYSKNVLIDTIRLVLGHA